MTKMKQICLWNFANENEKYLFEVGEQLSISSRCACKDDKLRPQGFFSNEKLGLLPFRRRKTLIAVFSDGERLRISIQCKLYDLSDPVVIARRRKLRLGARKFSLMKGDDVLVSFSYWIPTTDKSGMGADIFEYAERITQDVQHKMQFLRILDTMHTGKLQEIIKEHKLEEIFGRLKS